MTFATRRCLATTTSQRFSSTVAAGWLVESLFARDRRCLRRKSHRCFSFLRLREFRKGIDVIARGRQPVVLPGKNRLVVVRASIIVTISFETFNRTENDQQKYMNKQQKSNSNSFIATMFPPPARRLHFWQQAYVYCYCSCYLSVRGYGHRVVRPAKPAKTTTRRNPTCRSAAI